MLLLMRREAELRAGPGCPGRFSSGDTASPKPRPPAERWNRTGKRRTGPPSPRCGTGLRTAPRGPGRALARSRRAAPGLSHLPPAGPPRPLALSIPSPAVAMGPRPPRPAPASPLPLATELGTEARHHWPKAQHAARPLATAPLSGKG